MSIQKDVEKLYLADAEKQKKNQKKKKNKRIITLIIIVLIIIALFVLMNYLGLGFGGGKGDGESSGESSVNAQTEVTTQTEIPKEYIDFKVSGSTYIYQGQEITLDKFCDTVKLMSSNVVVNIIDDNATKNAMDDVQKAFDTVGREYVLAKINTDSSKQESSSEAVSESESEAETEMVP